MATHLTRHAVQVALLVPEVRQRRVAQEGRCPRSGQVQLGQFRGMVRKLDLLADAEMVEVLKDLLGQGSRDVQPIGVLPVGSPNVVDEQRGDQAGLSRCQEGLAAVARR
jgi:hypothetical protein